MPATAEQTYRQRLDEISKKAAALPSKVAAMKTNPERRVNWGHAGDMARILALIEELGNAIDSTTEAHGAAR